MARGKSEEKKKKWIKYRLGVVHNRICVACASPVAPVAPTLSPGRGSGITINTCVYCTHTFYKCVYRYARAIRFGLKVRGIFWKHDVLGSAGHAGTYRTRVTTVFRTRYTRVMTSQRSVGIFRRGRGAAKDTNLDTDRDRNTVSMFPKRYYYSYDSSVFFHFKIANFDKKFKKTVTRVSKTRTIVDVRTSSSLARFSNTLLPLLVDTVDRHGCASARVGQYVHKFRSRFAG